MCIHILYPSAFRKPAKTTQSTVSQPSLYVLHPLKVSPSLPISTPNKEHLNPVSDVHSIDKPYPLPRPTRTSTQTSAFQDDQKDARMLQPTVPPRTQVPQSMLVCKCRLTYGKSLCVYMNVYAEIWNLLYVAIM